MTSELYQFAMRRIDGTEMPLGEFKNRVLLIVNVASECGLTPQYDGLEKLYEKYQGQGFEVLGFPANEFGAQEPGSNSQIQEFCRTKFGVRFPMFEKIVVKGPGQHPLYGYLTQTSPKAFTKSTKAPAIETSEIRWNFEKFLIGRNGAVVARFAPDIVPMDPDMVQAIETELSR